MLLLFAVRCELIATLRGTPIRSEIWGPQWPAIKHESRTEIIIFAEDLLYVTSRKHLRNFF